MNVLSTGRLEEQQQGGESYPLTENSSLLRQSKQPAIMSEEEDPEFYSRRQSIMPLAHTLWFIVGPRSSLCLLACLLSSLSRSLLTHCAMCTAAFLSVIHALIAGVGWVFVVSIPMFKVPRSFLFCFCSLAMYRLVGGTFIDICYDPGSPGGHQDGLARPAEHERHLVRSNER